MVIRPTRGAPSAASRPTIWSGLQPSWSSLVTLRWIGWRHDGLRLRSLRSSAYSCAFAALYPRRPALRCSSRVMVEGLQPTATAISRLGSPALCMRSTTARSDGPRCLKGGLDALGSRFGPRAF